MAKTLKDFLEGYLKVKSADEQKFVDKHVTAKNPDRNGNGDDVFNGKTKPVNRRKERHGYEPGEDEKVYEELKGNQHKLDKNHNGELDAHDFKLLRKNKKAQAAELKAGARIKKTQAAEMKRLADAKERRQAFSRANNVADMRKYAKEEAEQIDELDRQLGGTLSRYINKTAGDEKREKGRNLALSKRWGDTKYGTPEPKVKAVDRFKEEAELQEGDGTGTYSVNSKHKKHNELVKAGFKHQAFKHGDGKVMHTYWSPGYRNADLQKVLGEEAEQIDELSTATLQSYRKKARAQGNAIVDKMKMGGGDWSKDQKDTKTLRKRAAGAQASGKQLVKRGESLKTEEAEHIDEAGYSAKAAHAGKDLGKPGKNFSKIANKAAAKYGSKASGERVAGAVLAKLRKEEKLAEMISDLSESHQRTMMNVFEKLNEDNKSKFLEACDTPEGVEQMLDFAINHRGE